MTTAKEYDEYEGPTQLYHCPCGHYWLDFGSSDQATACASCGGQIRPTVYATKDDGAEAFLHLETLTSPSTIDTYIAAHASALWFQAEAWSHCNGDDLPTDDELHNLIALAEIMGGSFDEAADRVYGHVEATA